MAKINQILTDGQISAESSALLKDELARNDGMQGFVQCLKSERALGVACELQRTALDRGNADDLNIEQLGIDERFTIDPYTGKRLLTRKSPQGWTVYSVGRNGKDDGGNIGPPFEDVGAGPVAVR